MSSLDYLYDFCPSPHPIDSDKLNISVASFIFSYLEGTELGSSIDISEVYSAMKGHDHVGDKYLNYIVGPNDEVQSKYLAMELYKSIKILKDYSDRGISYPFSEILRIYRLLAFDQVNGISTVSRQMSIRYSELYNEMVDNKDEIMGSVNFIVGYLTYASKALPTISDRTHLLVAYMTVNYFILTLNYHMAIPMFNDNNVISICKTVSRSDMESMARYKLIIGNYLLSGLDSSLDLYLDAVGVQRRVY